MDGRRQRADRPFRDEHAVSEVLGVIMLLAMVMTITLPRVTDRIPFGD